ncbi:MAG: phenylacetate-CoA oxygenase subunit PaaC [Hyphomicrobiales bacterium]|nr:phenylacetate-CoA oxygenase subunit PaaC [Hyphomicrobiales bacterium]MDE2113526.1 phenylacetate-CoA oxygenase subunit PaaC [Hyphomicrobiales bacterium]
MIDQPLFHYALRLGDDSLILGQRLSEWCGHAAALEVDLSLTNIGLDLIGQATSALGYAGDLEGAGRDADGLAFHRDALDYENCLLVEQPNGDFGQTIARQFLFSNWHWLFLSALAASKDATLAAMAAKSVKEVSYHVEFANDWMVRLGDGTPESHQRLSAGLDWNWRFVEELFIGDDVDNEMVQRGIGVDKASLRAAYDARIIDVLNDANLPVPKKHRAITGGRRGHHSEHLGHLLSQMQFLQRAYPGASW